MFRDGEAGRQGNGRARCLERADPSSNPRIFWTQTPEHWKIGRKPKIGSICFEQKPRPRREWCGNACVLVWVLKSKEMRCELALGVVLRLTDSWKWRWKFADGSRPWCGQPWHLKNDHWERKCLAWEHHQIYMWEKCRRIVVSNVILDKWRDKSDNPRREPRDWAQIRLKRNKLISTEGHSEGGFLAKRVSENEMSLALVVRNEKFAPNILTLCSQCVANAKTFSRTPVPRSVFHGVLCDRRFYKILAFLWPADVGMVECFNSSR